MMWPADYTLTAVRNGGPGLIAGVLAFHRLGQRERAAYDDFKRGKIHNPPSETISCLARQDSTVRPAFFRDQIKTLPDFYFSVLGPSLTGVKPTWVSAKP